MAGNPPARDDPHSHDQATATGRQEDAAPSRPPAASREIKGEFDDPNFTDAERERLKHWRQVCAQRPPLTREQIDTVAALLRVMDQRRASKTRHEQG